jgi:hypothetical protein
MNGKVKVKELRSEGEVSGEISADAVELSGTVKDSTVIQAKTLEVKLSQQNGMQVSFGNCRLQVSGAPVPPSQQAQSTASAQQGQQKAQQPVPAGSDRNKR